LSKYKKIIMMKGKKYKYFRKYWFYFNLSFDFSWFVNLKLFLLNELTIPIVE